MLSLGGIVGCGVEQPVEDGSELYSMAKTLQDDNGLSLNGLSLNGLSLNGLSLNGLSLNGLSTAEFNNWFTSSDGGNLESHQMLMSYLVRCALPEGQRLVFTPRNSNARYVWDGGMGLAPGWASGEAATLAEQQVVSACLAAHVNNYRLHVPISVLGKDAQGQVIPYTNQEIVDFGQQEACFFGNLFAPNPKLYVGSNASLSPEQSTPRPCGLTVRGQEQAPVAMCSQMERIGRCENRCQMGSNSNFFEKCTVEGVEYKPLTTRIRAMDVTYCGDDICQPWERKGPGYTPDSCKSDCGQ